MLWIITLVILWEHGFVGGTPYVAVVNGDAYMNWTITNLDDDTNRYIRHPAGNASLVVFQSSDSIPYIFDNRCAFTGDLSQGIVSVTLSDVKLSDAGKYTFTKLAGTVDLILGGQLLVVVATPNIQGIIPLYSPAVVGREYKLNCSTESRSAPVDHNMTMYSEWKENGVNITVGSGYSVNGTILTISNLTRKENGNNITCRAFEDRRMISAESSAFVMNVLYGPAAGSITLFPNQMSYEQVESSSLSINCSADCYPSCQYRWTGPGLGNYPDTGALIIHHIKRDQAGVFTCSATNPRINNTSATATLSVIVLYPPTISIESRNGSFSETGLMINCSAHGIPERYTYSLIHSSLFSGIKIQHLIDNEPVSTGVFVHWFRNPSFMDTGVYTCIVSNGILDYRDGSRDKNVSATVWITGPPNVTSSDRDFYAEKGDSGRLVIEFYNSLLDTSVTWNKKGNQTLEKLESFPKYNISVDNTMVGVKFYSVLIQQPGFITTLDIKNVTEEDFCSYQVLLQNSVGNLSDLTLNLRPRGRPDVPKDVHVITNRIATRSLDIEWVSSLHGGSNQTFVIEFKTQVDESWNNYSHDVFGGMMQHKYYNITVGNLQQNTLYFFKLYAWNVFGRSEYSSTINATTYAESNKHEIANEVIIGGAVGAVVLLSIMVAVVSIILYRRRRVQKSHSDGTPLELDARVFLRDKVLDIVPFRHGRCRSADNEDKRLHVIRGVDPTGGNNIISNEYESLQNDIKGDNPYQEMQGLSAVNEDIDSCHVIRGVDPTGGNNIISNEYESLQNDRKGDNPYQEMQGLSAVNEDIDSCHVIRGVDPTGGNNIISNEYESLQNDRKGDNPYQEMQGLSAVNEDIDSCHVIRGVDPTGGNNIISNEYESLQNDIKGDNPYQEMQGLSAVNEDIDSCHVIRGVDPTGGNNIISNEYESLQNDRKGDNPYQEMQGLSAVNEDIDSCHVIRGVDPTGGNNIISNEYESLQNDRKGDNPYQEMQGLSAVNEDIDSCHVIRGVDPTGGNNIISNEYESLQNDRKGDNPYQEMQGLSAVNEDIDSCHVIRGVDPTGGNNIISNEYESLQNDIKGDNPYQEMQGLSAVNEDIDSCHVIRGVDPTGGNNIISNEYESLQNDRKGDNPYQEMQGLSAVNEDIDSCHVIRGVDPTGGNNIISNEYESLQNDRKGDNPYQEMQGLSAVNEDIDSCHVIRGVDPTGGNNIISNEYESLQNDRKGDNPYQEMQDLSAVNEDIDSRSDARRLILQTAGNNTTSNEYESPRSCRVEVHSYLELQDISAGPREEATARSMDNTLYHNLHFGANKVHKRAAEESSLYENTL